MLTLFRTNQLLFGVFLIFYAVALHLCVFFIPDEWTPTGAGFFSKHFYQWIGFRGVLPDIIAILLLFVHAVAINALAARHRLSDMVTLFPGLFYILIASALPDFLHLSPLHLANTFYLIVIFELMATYKQPSCADRIFNIGFWLAIGSLFYFSYLILIIFGLIGMNTLRAFKLKEWLMMLSGAAVPYLLIGTYSFWIDGLDTFVQQQFADNFGFWDFIPLQGVEGYFKLAFVGFLLLIVLLSYSLYVSKKNIQVQKKIGILYYGLLFAIGTVLFQSGVQLDNLLVLAIPMGILLAINFLSITSRWAEALHLILLFILLFFQYRTIILPS